MTVITTKDRPLDRHSASPDVSTRTATAESDADMTSRRPRPPLHRTRRLLIAAAALAPLFGGHYASAATGYDISPRAVINGSNTLISTPAGIWVDGTGRLFVANWTANRVSSFAAGQVGNVSPGTSLFGASTGIDHPQWVAVDATGRLYVSHANGRVLSFPRLATGNVSPTTTLTGLTNSQGIAFDAAGNLHVADYGAGAVRVFGANRDGAASPIRSITGLTTPHAVAIDSGGRLYVANTGNGSIDVFAPGAAGAAIPIRRIAGANTGFGPKGPGVIALDAAGNIYEIDYEGAPEIRIFRAGADGNVPPIATVSGPSTGLSTPTTVVLGPNADLYVANSGTSPYYPNPGLNAVTIYTNPLVARPPGPAVAWSSTAGAVEVAFTVPPDNGGPLGATYTARCASPNGGVTRTATAAAPTIRVGDLTPGSTYTCAVRAANALGESPFSQASNAVTVYEEPSDHDPPEAPVVTYGPEASAETRPYLAWRAGEPGGFFEWRLLDDTGGTLASARTSDTQATLGPLAPGTYVFQVRHIDAAGNASPHSAPRLVTVLPPAPVPSNPPGAAPASATVAPTPPPAPSAPTGTGSRPAPRPRLTRTRVIAVLLGSGRVPNDVKAMIRRGEDGDPAAGVLLRLADWTGDGRPEGVAEVSAGGAGRTHAYYIVSDHGGRSRIVAGNAAAFNVSLVRRGRGFTERIPRYSRTDPLCCARRTAVRTFRWNGARFVQVGRTRIIRRR